MHEKLGPPFVSPETFLCIGPACEDTCCQGWNIPIDRTAFEKYRNLPAGPLSDLIAASVVLNCTSSSGESATGATANNAVDFAQIHVEGAQQCPLLSSERLCRIHEELGEDMLARACSSYPRITHEIGGLQETALALSCPEAARLVLLNPNLLYADSTHATERWTQPLDTQPPATVPAEHTPDRDGKSFASEFVAIRAAVLALVRMRSYPLWQRMFLLGLLCRRLDSIARGELNRSVPEFLADFIHTAATGALRPAMETLPVDRAAQLDAVLRLAGLMLHRSYAGPRFSASIQAFTAGIGNGPGATLASLTAQYTRAHDLAFEPFFSRHPHILENYLINTIVRCRFPFGQEGMDTGATPDRSREFARLTAQFTLIRGLLIGVAGYHGAAFSAEHVVATVQSAAKHFEHHPEFLKLAYELLLESRLDGARGMAILLRNAGQETSDSVQPGTPLPMPYLPENGVQPSAPSGL
jgi:lysine-N-methylase